MEGHEGVIQKFGNVKKTAAEYITSYKISIFRFPDTIPIIATLSMQLPPIYSN